MTTYYTIHAYDQLSEHLDEMIRNYTLYKSFKDARDALEKEIHKIIQQYYSEGKEVFERPDITGIQGDRKYCVYYETSEHVFTIRKWTVAE